MKRFFLDPVNWLLILLTGFAFTGWIFQLACFHQIMGYKYLYIPSIPVFLLEILFALVIPTALLLVAVSYWQSGKWQNCLLWLVVYGLMFVAALFAGVLLCFTVSSYTANPENFGQYDYLVDNVLNNREISLFPEELPADAKDIQYEYRFMMEEELYIAVSWTAEEEYLLRVQTDLAQFEPAWSQDGQFYWKFYANTYDEGIIVDLSQGKVCYILAQRDATLPDTVKDVFPGVLPK